MRAVETLASVRLLLLGAGLVACGGLAADGNGLGGVGGDPPFLAACGDQSCGAGFECLERVCTRPCGGDAQCSSLAQNAECVTGPTIGANGGGICGVPCSSDEACSQLGAGSYCDFAFCVAGSLEALPESFEELTLRRVPEDPVRVGVTACDPNEFTTRIQIVLRSRQIVWAQCVPSADQSGFEFQSASSRLTEAQVALLLRAYRELSLSTDRKCTAGAESLALDLELDEGPDMLFADEEHSACPVERLQRGSYVSGLNDLYSALELVIGSFSP